MMEVIIIILLILLMVSITANYYIYKKALKVGVDQFLKIIMQDGFKLRVDQFKVQNQFVTPKGIVFVGDSITQGYNVYEFFKGYDVYNRGIGGDTTKGLMTRLDTSIFDLKPAKVFLLIGTNDLSLLETTPKEIALRIEEIVNTIKNRLPDVKVYIESIYPVVESNNQTEKKPRKNKNIQEINSYLRTIKHAEYIDLYSILIHENQLNSKYTYDGLHINDIGYEVISNVLRNYI